MAGERRFIRALGGRTLIAVFCLLLPAGVAVADYRLGERAMVGGAVGGALGGYLGAELGGREGAILGGMLGAGSGVAVATPRYRTARHYSPPRRSVIYHHYYPAPKRYAPPRYYHSSPRHYRSKPHRYNRRHWY